MVLKQCRSGVKRTPLHSQALESSHALKEPMLLSTHRALKTPSFLSYFSPSQGKKRGIQTCQLRSGGGAEGTPQNVLLRNLEAKRMGEGPGAGISDPPPWALGGLQEAPLSQPAIWPQGCGESRGSGMGTVTIGSLKFPRLAAGKLKCTPMGVEWGGALPPTPQCLAFGLRVCCLFLNLHAPSEQMGSWSRWMVLMTSNTLDSLRTWEKRERPQRSELSLISSLKRSPSPTRPPHSIPHTVVQKMPAGGAQPGV